MAKNDLIFNKYDNPDFAYILRKGELIYEVLPGYNFNIEASPGKVGTEKIFGASEILISKEYDLVEPRHFTVKEGYNCEYSKIPKQNLLQWISSYNIGWNAGQLLAEVITKLHKIVLSLEKDMKSEEIKNKDLLALYANIVNLYKEEANKREIEWFNEFIKEIEANPLYSKGLQYIVTPSKVEIDKNKSLDKFKKTYPSGASICKKGDEADVLYILSKGKIKVTLEDGTAIDVINDKGSVIGEMAILLGDKRTANMTAIDNVQLIAIKKEEIKGLFQSEPRIFITTLTNLSMREAYNCNYIKKLNDMINQDTEERKKSLEIKTDEYKKQLNSLKNKINELNEKYNRYEWLKNLTEAANEKFNTLNI